MTKFSAIGVFLGTIPYKEGKFLPPSQKSLLLWDAFKAQSTPKVIDILSSYGIESVMVPRNMTHLLQPLGLTTNASFKEHEKQAFSKCFTLCIMDALKIDPDRDVTSIFLRLSTLKPRQSNDRFVSSPPVP